MEALAYFVEKVLLKLEEVAGKKNHKKYVQSVEMGCSLEMMVTVINLSQGALIILLENVKNVKSNSI